MENGTKKHREFKAAYEKESAACERLLKVIAIQMEEHRRSVPKVGINYGLVGDLSATRELLEQIATFAECGANEEEAVALKRALAKVQA